jgi:peptidoglycan/xylan/chitin deacetylase (PgdA/CDA1 family)
MRRSKSKILIVVFVILGIILVGLASFFYYKKTHVTVALKGTDSLEQNVFSEYEEKGVLVKKGDIELTDDQYSLEIDGNVDIEKLGKYVLTYMVKYKNKEYTFERTVNVVDKEAPIIETNLDKVNQDYCTKKYKEKLTYTANDNYDGDITDNITKEEKDDEIILTVSDENGNITTKSIPISVSKKPDNVLKLNGNSTIKVKNGGEFKDPGASYQDGCGKVLDTKVEVKGTVDTSTNGDYTLTYTYAPTKDTITRKVTVYTPAKKLIYLTFDDGPCAYTPKVLDILDKYNIKATFFVTHQFNNYVHLIKDEHERGHAVAVHTYSHKWSVYDSLENYLKDFNAMNDTIYELTGKRSKIFRFPGGSSNTVSRSHAIGIVTEIAKKMTEDGYVYYDWNVSSGDASNATSTQIYNNVVRGVEKCSKCVVLMHDIKLTTLNALDNMLKTLTDKGYSFATLDENGPVVHHTIHN